MGTTNHGKGRLIKDGEKVRNAEVIIYPDTIYCPVDMEGEPLCTPFARLISFLDGCGIKCLCSPLHDNDVYDLDDVVAWRRRYALKYGLMADAEKVITESPKVGQKKEPHYHVDLYASGPHDAAYWVDFLSPLCDYPKWRIARIDNPYTATRYLAHMDSPTKAGYPSRDVMAFGGASLAPLFDNDEVKRAEIDGEIREVIRDMGFRHYNQLFDWAIQAGSYEYFASVKGKANVWALYFGGMKAEAAERKERKKREEQKNR